MVWATLILVTRKRGRVAVFAMSPIAAILLVLVPIYPDFSSLGALLDSFWFSVKAAANVDFATSDSGLSGFWWSDLMAKMTVSYLVCLAGAWSATKLSYSR